MFSLSLVLVCLLEVTVSSLQEKVIKNIGCECKEADKCTPWLDAVTSGKYLDIPICGYQPNSLQPLVCCPKGLDIPRRRVRDIAGLEGIKDLHLTCRISSQGTSPAAKAKQKCAEYAKYIFQNVYEVSIGDGPYEKPKQDTCVKNLYGDEDETAQPREFPHMALIGFEDKNKTVWVCAGSLISERFILGVAHCTETPRLGPARWAKLGDLDISTDTDLASPQIFKIAEIIVHPSYDSKEKYNDIALYKLDKDIDLSSSIYIRPACLFTRRDPPDNTADATGWGRTTFGGKASKVLKKVKMDLVTTKDCNKNFNDTRILSNGINGESMICAVESSNVTVTVCQGDSGGPLQIKLKEPYCMFALIGVTSFGKGCGLGVPGVNTRVSHFVPWIVNHVWPDDE